MKRCLRCRVMTYQFYPGNRACKSCVNKRKCANVKRKPGECWVCHEPEPASGFSQFAVRCGDIVRFRKRGMCDACLETRGQQEHRMRQEDVSVVEHWIHQFVSTDTQCQNYLMAKGA